jgi:gluconokinase
MGVSGAGKTRIGRDLAHALGWAFLDADDFHPQVNVEKMRGGVPLETADRAVWLDALTAALASLERGGADAVIACSALRREFRESLAAALTTVRFVYLKADAALVRERVAAREGHFMPAALVDSQFATLEEPDDALVIDASMTPEAIVGEIVRQLS